jgi:hypothetical protein
MAQAVGTVAGMQINKYDVINLGSQVNHKSMKILLYELNFYFKPGFGRGVDKSIRSKIGRRGSE